MYQDKYQSVSIHTVEKNLNFVRRVQNLVTLDMNTELSQLKLIGWFKCMIFN